MTVAEILPLHAAAGSQISLLHFAVGSQILPLKYAAVSQILPLDFAAGNQILPLHDTARSQFLLLHDAVGSQILPPHDAAGSQFGSGESSLKPLEDSLGLKRDNHVIKSHMGGLLYPYPVRIMYNNSPNLQSFFDSPLHHAAGSPTSNSNNSMNLKQKTKRF
jgi:hypothetical protein